MRGTTYAISEIIWWMVAALAVGVLIGWLLRRWFGGEARLKDVQAELEAKNVRYAELSGELGESKQLVESLNRGLEARTGELSEATDRVGDLESNLSSARAELEAAGSATGEVASGVSVAERDERIMQLESEVAGLKSDLNSTAAALAEVRTAHADCTVTAEATSGRIAGLETAVAERDARIADLESGPPGPTTRTTSR